MYSENDYRLYTELYHHGIQGQKWGVRNGPPYPLNASSRKRMYKQRMVGANEHPKFTRKDQLEYLREHPIEKLSEIDRIKSGSDTDGIRFAINHLGSKNGRFYNCPNCAAAFEMTERGYDVVARPKPNGSNVENVESFFNEGRLQNVGIKKYDKEYQTLYDEWRVAKDEVDKASKNASVTSLDKLKVSKAEDREISAFDNFDAKHQIVATQTEKQTIEAILSQGEGSRGIIVTGWRDHYDPNKRTTSFHAQNYVVENGQIVFYDTQSKHDYSGYKNTDWISRDCDPREVFLMRTDNLELSDTIGEAVISRRKSE